MAFIPPPPLKTKLLKLFGEFYLSHQHLSWPLYFYRPQTKFAKVMFLQASVCPQGGGVRGCSWGGCVVAPGGVRGCSRGDAWLLRGDAWLLWGREACMVAPGGMHGCSGGACVVAPGGCAWLLQGGMHGCSGGACVVALGGGRHAWLLRGGSGVCVVALGGVCAMVAPGGRAWR